MVPGVLSVNFWKHYQSQSGLIYSLLCQTMAWLPRVCLVIPLLHFHPYPCIRRPGSSYPVRSGQRVILPGGHFFQRLRRSLSLLLAVTVEAPEPVKSGVLWNGRHYTEYVGVWTEVRFLGRWAVIYQVTKDFSISLAQLDYILLS